MGAATVEVNDANFESEIDLYKGLALVDFWGAACGPCRKIGPAVDQFAAEYKGKVKVCKVDVEEAPGATMRSGIRSIPCLMIFKDGKSVDQFVGAPPNTKEFLKTWLDGQLA